MIALSTLPFVVLLTAVGVQRQVRVAAGNGKGKGKMMWEALREAIDEEMEKDPTVCVMGK